MAIVVTEVRTIKIDHECKDNPVYLAWLGTDGNWNYWLFHKVQTEALDTEVTGEFVPYISDLEDAIGNGEYMGKESTPQLIVGANVDEEDIGKGILPSQYNQGLKSLINSPYVQMLSNPDTWEADGVKWMRVKVVPGTFKIIDTNQSRATIELTLLLPTYNIQQQ